MVNFEHIKTFGARAHPQGFGLLDPWGGAYEFLNIQAAGPANGAYRKNGKLNPLHTDFDLYSRGRDGDSQGPLSAKASRNDIVRASDGAYIGLGEDD